MSCKNSQNEKIDFQISFEPNKMLNLSLIADSVKIIELAEHDTCLIGNIDRIQVYNNCLYIDDGRTSSVFRYTLDGKFLNKIGHRGDDPKGYAIFGGSYVKNDIVYIYDSGTYRFLQYDTCGSFLGNTIIQNEIPIRDFVVGKQGILAYYVKYTNEPNSGVYLINPKGETVNRIIKPENEYLLNPSVGGHFCEIKDGLYGIVDYNNRKIHHITNDSAYIAYTFSVDKDIPENIKYQYPINLSDGEYYNAFQHYVESDNFIIIIAYEEFNKFVTTFYDKKTKQTVSGKCEAGEGLINDDLGRSIWFSSPYYYDNKLFAVLMNNETESWKIEIVYLK